jgi:hypothetical protein
MADLSGQFPLSPPGFQSPAAFPYAPPFPANDVPVAGAPYLIAQLSNTVSSVTTAIPVQNTSAAGDAIAVLVGSGGTGIPPVSCADTQGNKYLSYSSGTSGQGVFHFIAVNSNPLTPADTITVTWASATAGFGTVLGCKSSLIQAGGGTQSYLVPVYARNGISGSSATQTFPVFSVIAMNQPVLLVLTAAFPTAAAAVLQNVGGSGGWNVISTVTRTGPSTMVAAWQVLPGMAASEVLASLSVVNNVGALLVTALIPETRYAAQPGLMPGSAPSPPGLLSPGAWPVLPQQLTTVSDVPPAAGSPYLIARGQTAAAAATITVPVANPTGAGDVILVAATTGNSGGNRPVSCTDTQGNTYTLLGYVGTNASSCLFAAYNTVPLTPADSITVTLAQVLNPQGVIVTGIPSAALTGSPGQWLSSAATAFTSVGVGTGNLLTAPYAIAASPAAPVLLAVADSGTFQPYTGLPPETYPQGWTLAGQLATQIGSASRIRVWTKVVTSPITAGQVLYSVQTNAGAGGNSLLLTALIPETRFAPRIPPDMPPGMTSPGAWQHQPGFSSPGFTGVFLQAASVPAVPPAAAAVAVPAPAVSASSTAAPAALAITAAQPAVMVTSSVIISPAATSVAAAQPAVTVTSSVIISPAALAVAAAQPAVAATASSAASPAATSVTAAQPAVSASASSAASPAAVTAAAQSAVSASASSAASPAATSVTVAQPASSAAASSAASLAAASVTVTQPAVTVTSSAALAPSAFAAATSFPAVSVSASSAVSPAAVSATVSQPASSASASSAASPAAASVTVSQPASSASASSAASPAAAAVTVSVPAVLVQVDANIVLAAALAAAVTQPAAAVTASSVAAPAALAVAGSRPGVQASASSAVTCTPLAVSPAQPAVAISSGSAISAAAIAIAAFIPAPVVRQDRLVAATTLAVTLIQPAAAAGGGAGPPPALLTAAAAFPAALSSAGSHSFPALLAATAAQPAPLVYHQIFAVAKSAAAASVAAQAAAVTAVTP